jgi:hypothetical protein
MRAPALLVLAIPFDGLAEAAAHAVARAQRHVASPAFLPSILPLEPQAINRFATAGA